MKTMMETDKRHYRQFRDSYQRIYLHGKCYEFAIALHEGLGWPMIGLMNGEEVFHAGVLTPNGSLYDVRGSVPEEKFGEPFGKNPPYTFRRISMSDFKRPVGRYDINGARIVAETIFPRLPWKESYALRVRTFMDELETLCRKHGLWIRGPLPKDVPIIYPGDDDENGYLVQPLMTSQTFTFSLERRFRQ